MEWIQARSYYTILSRRHPANLKHIGHGSVVHADAVKEMHRVAHSRRAHDRILRSPRYKKMQGQTIRINEMWVGPKEWQDADSKQIYKIVE